MKSGMCREFVCEAFTKAAERDGVEEFLGRAEREFGYSFGRDV